MRSTPRKPAWPSLVWNTSGSGSPVSRGPGADGAHAADAEQHLLVQAVVGAAAVEPVGDLALLGCVLLHVGVEQQQRHAADLRPPDLGVQRAALGHVDADGHRRAVRLGDAASAAGRAGRAGGSAPAASPRR